MSIIENKEETYLKSSFIYTLGLTLHFLLHTHWEAIVNDK